MCIILGKASLQLLPSLLPPSLTLRLLRGDALLAHRVYAVHEERHLGVAVQVDFLKATL